MTIVGNTHLVPAVFKLLANKPRRLTIIFYAQYFLAILWHLVQLGGSSTAQGRATLITPLDDLILKYSRSIVSATPQFCSSTASTTVLVLLHADGNPWTVQYPAT